MITNARTQTLLAWGKSLIQSRWFKAFCVVKLVGYAVLGYVGLRMV